MCAVADDPAFINCTAFATANVVGGVTTRWTWSETPPMHLGIIPCYLAIPLGTAKGVFEDAGFRTGTGCLVLKTR
jgi:hypothetical protein